MLRIGLIGAGVIARDHALTFPKLDGARVVAVADPLVERARELAGPLGAEAHADFRAMIGAIDLAWVCTPPVLHREQTVELASAGVHVFCEKPIALDVATADEMIDACRRRGVHLMIGHVIRYYPETVAIKRMLEAGELGDPTFAFAHRLLGGSALLRGRRDVSIWGGFSVESGIHEADTVRTLGGEVARVYARAAFGDAEFPQYDTDYRALLTLRNGATGQILESVASPIREWSWGVIGSRGAAVSTRRGEVRVSQPGDQERTLQVDPVTDPATNVNGPMLAENQAFVDAVLADRQPPIPGEEGRRNLAVVLAGLRAARDGCVIDLPGS